MERVPERVLEVGIQNRFDLMGRDAGGDLFAGLGRDPLFRLFGLRAGSRLLRLTRSSKYLDISRDKGYSADVSWLLIDH